MPGLWAGQGAVGTLGEEGDGVEKYRLLVTK